MKKIKPLILISLFISVLNSPAHSADVNFSVTGKVTAGTCKLAFGSDTPADGALDFGTVTQSQLALKESSPVIKPISFVFSNCQGVKTVSVSSSTAGSTGLC